MDLEHNISKTIDGSTKSKVDYLSSLFEGSETATRENPFEEYVKTAEKKEIIIKRVREIAVSATTIPLSIFTNIFHQRFSKHVYLESTLEILQQFYIAMNSDNERYCVIPGDLCNYTLKCVRCHRSITSPGTIGETLYHAPIAMLCHWDMIANNNPSGDFGITHVPLLCSGMDSFESAQASFQETNKNVDEPCISLEKKNEIGFCEAVKVDVSRLKEANFPASITKTLALLSVLFEDFGVAVELHETEKKTLKWHFQ